MTPAGEVVLRRSMMAVMRLGMAVMLAVTAGRALGAGEFPETAASGTTLAGSEAFPAAGAETADLTATATGARPVVAVLSFEAVNTPPGEAAAITEFVEIAVAESGLFDVIGRQAIDRVLTEQALPLAGCAAVECALKVGKLLDAGKMVAGSYSLLDGTRVVSARMVDVETGSVETEEKAEIADVRSMDVPLRRIIDRLFARYRGDGEPEKAPPEPAPDPARYDGLKVGVLDFGGKGGEGERRLCRRIVCGALHAEGIHGVVEIEDDCLRRFGKNAYGGRVSFECAGKAGKKSDAGWVVAGELLDRETISLTVIHAATRTLSYEKTTLTARADLTEATKYIASLLKKAYAP